MREMKDSGVAWIGKIPAQWDVRKIASVVPVVTDFVASGSFADLRENVKYIDTPDYAMLVRTADLSGTRDNTVYIDKHAYEYLSNSNLFGGEIILSNIGSVGNVFQYTPMYERSSLAPNAIMLNGTECNRYLYYWFLNPIANDELKRIGSQAVQLKFNKTQLKQMAIVYPPLEIQHKIAAHLDRKCTQIDLLIANEEQQIAKLKAYKQSVITETVTKGLDSDVPLKDSGIEWIGEIPERWEVTRVKNKFSLRNEKNYEPDLSKVNLISLYTDLGVIQHSDIKETSGNKAVTAEGYKKVYEGDIVVNIILCWMGAIGKSSYNGVTSPAYDIYKPLNNTNSNYYHYLFRTKRFNGECYRNGRGIMMMRWRTYSTEFSSIFIPEPPYEEQQQIADYLDKKCEQIDRLIAIKNQKIEKLQQYKKSLIYEFVTGKKEV